MFNKKIAIISIIVALIFFALGLITGLEIKSGGNFSQSGNLLSSIVPSGQNSYQAGWEAAKKRLAESGFAPMMTDLEIKTISGEIKEIKGSKISLTIRPLEPLADPELDNRVITIDNQTKIYQLVQKDTAEYQKEMAEFNKKMQEQMAKPGTATQPLLPPDYFTKKLIQLTDLKVGQQVSATAAQDIKTVKEFTALEISAQGLPIAPTTMLPATPSTAALPTSTAAPAPTPTR